MRFLPDKPSLGFLRKEAKDLLAALRESSPAASLTDAQRALAAEYGMRDWAELKSEVERRANAVPVAPAGLAEALASTFDLGAVTGTASPVSFTPMGRCWSLVTDRGRWLAVTVFDWITNEQAELGARLRDAAVAVGVAAPTPVRSPRGCLIETVQDQNWRVHEWIEVGPSPVLPTPLAVARGVGTAYGKLHALAIPSELPINWYLTTHKSDADWTDLLARARSAQKPWADQLAQTLPVLTDLRRIEPNVDPTDLILCNSNVIPEHVRIGHHDHLVITEWDFAGPLTPALEIGMALCQWTLRPTSNPQAATAFRDGYLEATGTWPTLNLSSFACATTAWLNWTYNTICESLDPADPDQADATDRGVPDLLAHPITRESLELLLTATNI
ncbi:hypothetical protein [Kribbella sp. CA-293567]|uniref:hypothetical protein n=1 Tax=Kribbella sp. CA-293567 TaxID=3002436 RepID=UPI0022DD770E|nr:hypothetical protein [Kribbella sp. CA-293567]WBQ04740.1 hypothetical protein OX958_32870 [Kribbella sp. CA-293567]